MALTTWGFVYTLGPDATDVRHDEIGSPACRLLAVGVPTTAHAAEATSELIDRGCELIEFCGAFTATEMADVRRATDASGTPVGAVTYGGDATSGLHRIFGAPSTS